MKIRKYLLAGKIINSGIGDLSVKWEEAIALKMLPTPQLNNPLLNYPKLSTVKNQVAAAGTQFATDYATNYLSNKIFDDSELGRGLGTLFSSGVSSAGNNISNNLLKGQFFAEGLGKDVGNSVAGAGVGLAANYIGKGVTSIIGNNYIGRATGAGLSTGLGTVGGAAASALAKGANVAGAISNINPYALAGNVIGSALSAGNGPSKEYGGKYGSTTRTMDTIYDVAMAGANFIPGVGQAISGMMALNKGLSNLFGSTSGMTKQDAILGSAFMPASVKWLNMAGASTTGNFGNQSWLNSQKANTFMGDAFGNLSEKFDKARDEAGKTYGTFSQRAKRKALDNLNFANDAWNLILAMADLNELLNIRSLYMTSINNQRYAQQILGGWNPLARGKYGMKILNNATNHNIGMRLLSGAALIDNKQMILSAQSGTKVTRPPRMRAHKKGDESRGLTSEEQEWWRLHEEEQKKLLEEETARKQKQQEEAANKFNKQTSIVMGAMTQQANETPFTGLEYQQAAEDLRQERVEKFHEAEKIGEAALMADMAVSAAPLLQRGFRWAFDKAGLLVRVPIQRTNLFLTSPYTGRWTLFGNREYRFKPGYAAMNGAPIESRPIKTVRLYRATGTNGKFDASLDGGQEFAGQWFTNNPTKPQHYASMTVKRARRAGVENPIELLYVDIPESELSKYKASEILKGRTDIEYEPTEDFLIPLDYPRLRVPLEGYTGNLLIDARRPLPELSASEIPIEVSNYTGKWKNWVERIQPKLTNKTYDSQKLISIGNASKDKAFLYYKSGEFVKRAKNAGFSDSEISLLQKELLDMLNHSLVKSSNSSNNGVHAWADAYLDNSGNLYRNVTSFEPHVQGFSLEDIISMWDHEFGHVATNMYNSAGRNLGNFMQLVESRYPMIVKMMKYNESIAPKFKSELENLYNFWHSSDIKTKLKQSYPELSELELKEFINKYLKFSENIKEYIGNSNELRSRALSTLFAALRKGKSAYLYVLENSEDLNAARELDNIFEGRSLKKYLDNFLNYSVPITAVGGTTYVSTK